MTASPNAQPPEVLVVGAGIVGMAIAWRLLREGARVTVVDADAPGEGGASFGNAGAISASSVAPLALPGLLRQVPRMLLDRKAPLHVPAGYWLRAAPWLSRFVAAARPASVARATAALDALLHLATEQHLALTREIGAPELLRPHGQLFLYRSEAQRAKDQPAWDIRRAHGARLEILDRAGIEALEPAVGPDYRIGVFLPDHAHCASPLRYVRTLAQVFTAAGGTILRDRIGALTVAEGRISGAQGAAAHYAAPSVVLAAGAWSARLAAPLGYRIPLESQRGYHVDLRQSGLTLTRPVIPADRKAFITPMEGALRVAGTVEFGGLDRAPNEARARLLLDDLAAVLPSARLTGEEGFWMGHRPCLPDSVPVIGPARRVPGLFFAFGHGHLGLTGAAPTAEILAPVVLGRPTNRDLAPYAAERFAGA